MNIVAMKVPRQKMSRQTTGLEKDDRVQILKEAVRQYQELDRNPLTWKWVGAVFVSAEEVARAVSNGFDKKNAIAKTIGYFSRAIRAEKNGDREAFKELLPGKWVVPVTQYFVKNHYGKKNFPENDHDYRNCTNSSGGIGIGILICDIDHPLFKFYAKEQILRTSRMCQDARKTIDAMWKEGAITSEERYLYLQQLDGMMQKRLPPKQPPATGEITNG